MNKRRRSIGLITVLTTVPSGVVFAEGVVPYPLLVCEIAGCPIDIDPWSCGDVTPLPDGTFFFTGRYDVDGLGGLNWTMQVDPDPFVIADFLVTQNTGQTQTFGIGFLLPYTTVGPTCIGGSIVGSVTDRSGDGATVVAPPGEWIYRATIDNQAVPGGNLLPSSTPVVAGPYGTASIGPAAFGQPIPSTPFVGVSTNIGLSLEFSITSRDAVNISSIFQVEPGCAVAAGGELEKKTKEKR